MTFLAPERLALLVVPALLVALYLAMQRRRRRYAVRFAAVELLDAVTPERPGLRRHLPALAYLLALGVLVFGVARPAMSVDTPGRPTVVLAFDTSRSMEATDVAPTRLSAARDAAHRFLDLVPDGVPVGLVAFDQTARAVVAPTTDRVVLGRAVDRLELGPGTAIGEALYTALDMLPRAETADAGSGQGIAAAPPTAPKAGGTIVLLSDGDTTVGRSEDDAARRAAELGVPVSTIAFGTPDGTVHVGIQTVRVPVDAAALRRVAETTGGRAFEAATADELRSVFEDLGQGVGVERVQREITDLFVGAALAFAVAAAIGSLAWFSRLP
jgi:Ca-activated chloride channel family protein